MNLALTYTNHLGRKARIADGGHLHLMKSDLFSHEWDYESEGQRVWGLRLDARRLTLPIGMLDGTLAERTELFQTFEADARSGVCGRLEFHGYVLECLPVAASLDAWWFADGIEERTVTLVAPRPLWARDESHSFMPTPEDQGTASAGLDYPHDYAHDWGRTTEMERVITVGTAGESEFRLIVYGPATDPYVIIAGNRYEVDVSVPSGSRLELDTRDRTIRRIGSSGDVTNCYAARVRGRRGGGSYAFQPLPGGRHVITCNGTFGFDIIIHDERTEPAWDA